MNDAEFRLLDEIEDDHWWFVGKRHLLAALLAGLADDVGRVLDLGCGTGGILRQLAGDRAFGIDRSELALRISARKGARRLVRGDVDRLPFAPGSFDTVVMLDVLEHLDDDAAFLRDAARVVRPGGRLVISVPAFQALWSRHDETFQHRRRYAAAQLERVVREAGLAPERTTYTNAAVFPAAAAWRLAARRLGVEREHDFVPVPRWLNRLLASVYRAEAGLLRRRDAPFGLSVACIARVPDRARSAAP